MRGRSRADRVFRLFLRLFPSEFRGDFGDEMSAVFRDERADAAAAGTARDGAAVVADARVAVSRPLRASTLAVLVRDATYGLRLMRKYPLATAAAILTIALGVGANTAMFTVVNAVLLQLPFEDPSRLVSVLPAGCPGPFGGDFVDAISNLERACRCRRVARGLHDVVACADGDGRPGPSQARVLLGQHVFHARCVAGHRPHVRRARRQPRRPAGHGRQSFLLGRAASVVTLAASAAP